MSDEPETIWAKAGMPGYTCECKPGVYDVEYTRADLSPQPKVKPVRWSHWDTLGPQLLGADGGCWNGNGALGSCYEIAKKNGAFFWYPWNQSHRYSDPFDDLDAAMAAVGAVDAEHILSALE